MTSVESIIRGIQLADESRNYKSPYDEDDPLAEFKAQVVDNDIELAIKNSRSRIFACGVGGAGSNAINRLTLTGIPGATTVAINTDQRHLHMVSSELKLIIGKELTGGLGAGNDPVIGRASAEESYESLLKLFNNVNLVFVTAGLGGGTGTGAAPIVARAARESGALVISVCTLPFKVEGEVRIRNAMMGLKELYQESDTVIVIPNEKLIEIAPDLPWHSAFKLADEILIRAVRGITNVVIKEQIVSVDFSDIRKILQIGGSAIIGMGMGEGSNKVHEAMEAALKNPLVDVDLSEAKGAVISITGGEDLSMQDIYQCINLLKSQINPKAEVIWGTTVEPSFKDKIQVTAVLSGVTSPYEPTATVEDPFYGDMPEAIFPE